MNEAVTTSVTVTRLDKLDLSLKLSRAEQDERLERGGERLAQLRLTLGAQIGGGELGPPVCVAARGLGRVGQGRGDQAPRRAARLAPRARRSFAAPTPDEKRHHYLHRFVPALPGWGGMAVLDRTWYGRVLVERVEGFATEAQWRRAYAEIVDFERITRRRGHDPRQVLAADLRRGAAAPLRARARRIRSRRGS